jgi:hypothetical protein
LSPFWIFHKNKKNLQHHPAAYMNNHGGMGPQRGGNDPVLGGHMHQLSSHSPTMGSPESKPVIQASMLAAYQGKKKNTTFLFYFLFTLFFSIKKMLKFYFAIIRWTTRQRTLFHGIGTDPVVAVSTRVADGQVVPELYFVDGRWLGVQAV